MSGFYETWAVLLRSFPYALSAGIVMAACCSFLGTLVVLKRLVFIGATLSQVATCGIAASFFFHWNPWWGAVAFTLAAVTILASAIEETRVPRDAVMAVLFVLSSSFSILFVSKTATGLEEVQSLIYGDLIITSASDFLVLSCALLPLTLLVLLFLRPILYTFVDREEAKALGINVRFWELFFYYLLGVVVSVASKLGGMLLVFSYLVVPAMAGLFISGRMKWALLISVTSAVLATLLGFYFSYAFDLPTNQLIVVMNGLLLGLTLSGKFISFRPGR